MLAFFSAYWESSNAFPTRKNPRPLIFLVNGDAQFRQELPVGTVRDEAKMLHHFFASTAGNPTSVHVVEGLPIRLHPSLLLTMCKMSVGVASLCIFFILCGRTGAFPQGWPAVTPRAVAAGK